MVINRLKIALFMLVFTCVFNAKAGIISGLHTTEEGKTVNLQGLEWMSLDYTAGLNRFVIESSNGFTDRYGNTWASNEWRYATRTETETLFESLWGGQYNGFSADNADGTKWFIDNFGGLAFDTWTGTTRVDGVYNSSTWQGRDFSGVIYGTDGECSTENWMTCYGRVYNADSWHRDISSTNVITNSFEVAYSTSQDVGLGSFSWFTGNMTGLKSTNYTEEKGDIMTFDGSLLVRSIHQVSVEVSEPSIFFIFLIGLAGLVTRRNLKLKRFTNFFIVCK